MDSNLKAWLNSLSPADRSIVVEKLGEIAVESVTDKFLEAARKGAGLPPEPDEDLNAGSNEDKAEAKARKAAGLKPAKKKKWDQLNL